MSHKKIDRFSRFDVYWIPTNKQTDKQANRQAKFIYRFRVLKVVMFFYYKKRTLFPFSILFVFYLIKKKLFQNEENVPKPFKTYSPNLFIVLLMRCIVLTVFL